MNSSLLNSQLPVTSTFSKLLNPYFENFEHKGYLYSGWISGKEEYNKFRNFLKDIGVLYSVRNSRACVSKQRENSNTNGNQNKETSRKINKRERVHFDSQGVAYMIDKVIYEDCKYGPQYWNSDPQIDENPEESVYGYRTTQKPRQRKCSTKKRNCPAKMLIKEVRVFPGYRVIRPNPNPAQKKLILQRLKNDLSECDAVYYTLCYYVEISTLEVHNHNIQLKCSQASETKEQPQVTSKLEPIIELVEQYGSEENEPTEANVPVVKECNHALAQLTQIVPHVKDTDQLQHLLSDVNSWYSRLEVFTEDYTSIGAEVNL